MAMMLEPKQVAGLCVLCVCPFPIGCRASDENLFPWSHALSSWRQKTFGQRPFGGFLVKFEVVW